MNFCKNCKYWQPDSRNDKSNLKFCERLSNQAEWDHKDQELFEIDGGNQQTYIWTAPSFGCNLFEPK